MVYTGKDAANRLTIAAYKKKGLGLEDLLRKVSQKMADARMLFCQIGWFSDEGDRYLSGNTTGGSKQCSPKRGADC